MDPCNLAEPAQHIYRLGDLNTVSLRTWKLEGPTKRSEQPWKPIRWAGQGSLLGEEGPAANAVQSPGAGIWKCGSPITSNPDCFRIPLSKTDSPLHTCQTTTSTGGDFAHSSRYPHLPPEAPSHQQVHTAPWAESGGNAHSPDGHLATTRLIHHSTRFPYSSSCARNLLFIDQEAGRGGLCERARARNIRKEI